MCLPLQEEIEKNITVSLPLFLYGLTSLKSTFNSLELSLIDENRNKYFF